MLYKEMPDTLYADGLISKEQHARLNDIVRGKLISINFEIRTFLYLGSTLFTGGLGIWIYKFVPLNQIALLGGLFALSALCFTYNLARRAPFSHNSVPSPTTLYDYSLVLACVLFCTGIGYAQYTLQIFGSHLQFVPLASAILYFFCAYFFDNRAVLALAITATATYVGISVSIQNLDFMTSIVRSELFKTGIMLGAVLAFVGYGSHRANFKRHFATIYLNFACLMMYTGFAFGVWAEGWTYFLGTIVCNIAVVYLAFRMHSLMLLFYTYLSLTVTAMWLLSMLANSMAIGSTQFFSLVAIYLIATPFGLIAVARRARKIFEATK